MTQDISPTLMAQRYFEEVESDLLRIKDNTTLAVRVSDFQLHSDAGVDLGINFQTGAGARRNVLGSSGNLTLTAAQSGSILLFDVVGATAYTLPAIAAADVGITFEFWSTVTATGAHSVTAAAADLLIGTVEMAVTGADTEVFHPNGSSHLILSMNGSTTGGIEGTRLQFTALSATRWGVIGIINTSGAQATPFA
jgi:hypothetical protein